MDRKARLGLTVLTAAPALWLTAVPAVAAPLATAARVEAASSLTSRQIVPGMLIITALLLTLVIVFGPRDRDKGPATKAGSRTAGRPVHAADHGDPRQDGTGAGPWQEAGHVVPVVHDAEQAAPACGQ